MQNSMIKRAKTTAILAMLGLISAGCAAQTGRTAGSYYESRRFVPRIYVEDNSFGVMSPNYHGCSYDQMYDGYWCPADR